MELEEDLLRLHAPRMLCKLAAAAHTWTLRWDLDPDTCRDNKPLASTPGEAFFFFLSQRSEVHPVINTVIFLSVT